MDNSQEHIDRAGMDSAAVEEAAGPQLFKTLQKSASFFSRTNNDSSENSSSKLSASGLSTWAKSFRMPSTFPKENSQSSSKSTFSLLGGGFGKKVSPAKIPVVDAAANETPSVSAAVSANNEGAFETLTKGFLDTSRNAVKAVQLRARHLVSQNKRRYQEDGFDLDLSYITENIIAMGFPAGDMSSGLLGYVEGFYRNHMEEVLKFFETHHKGKYKVYNLCSERLYDVSLLEGKVASFPFDDHNCPPLQLVLAFCLSAYDWLKGDLENVVVVHCKAGKARTGLMISSLLLYLKFFPSAEESIGHYNQRRCVDGKGLILPSQLRYVKYFERILNDFNGETPTGRKCILRGIRLHKCPYWIRPAITVSDHNGVLFTTKKHPRTKDMMPEDFWFSAPRKGVMVFALPGERCVADLNGDFKVHFHDRHGDFYCWLNTNMMEQRQIFNTSELDGFEKRKMPSPNFQVEIVVMDQTVLPPSPSPQSNPTATVATTPIATPTAAATATAAAATATAAAATTAHDDDGATANGDDIFSDSDDGEEEKKISFTAQSPLHEIQSSTETALPVENEGDATATSAVTTVAAATGEKDKEVSTAEVTEEEASDYVEISTASQQQQQKKSTADDLPTSDFKAMGADASVFTFGDDEDYDDSDE